MNDFSDELKEWLIDRGLFQLAMIRRMEDPGYFHALEKHNVNSLSSAFSWGVTPESYGFWDKVQQDYERRNK